MTRRTLTVSALPTVWIIDLDGVVFRHNAYLAGNDEVLGGAAQFWAQIMPADVVVVMTARAETERLRTLSLLADLGLRVDHAIFGLPAGERVVINDTKPSGLHAARAVNLPRDEGLAELLVHVDETL